MRHDLRAHDTLGWSNKLNVVFGRLLQNVRRRLAIVLGQFGQVIVESGPHVESNLLSSFLSLIPSPYNSG